MFTKKQKVASNALFYKLKRLDDDIKKKKNGRLINQNKENPGKEVKVTQRSLEKREATKETKVVLE